jgi:hypothetical protein
VDGIRVTPSFEVVVEPVDFARRDLVEGPLVSETGLVLLVVAIVLTIVGYFANKSKVRV